MELKCRRVSVNHISLSPLGPVDLAVLGSPGRAELLAPGFPLLRGFAEAELPSLVAAVAIGAPIVSEPDAHAGGGEGRCLGHVTATTV